MLGIYEQGKGKDINDDSDVEMISDLIKNNGAEIVLHRTGNSHLIKDKKVASDIARVVASFTNNSQSGRNFNPETMEMQAEFDRIQEAMKVRDRQDSERDAAPLKPAPDAVTLDTTELDLDEVVSVVLELARKSEAGKGQTR